jgi:4-alpha-glucanotransferase
MTEDSLDRLARLVGLARDYWTIDGVCRTPSPADRAALLDSFGWPSGSEADLARSLMLAENRPWARALPPVMVVTEGEHLSVPVILAEGTATDFRLESETGDVVTGRVGEAPPEAAIRIGGASLARHRLDLPVLPVGYHRLALPSLGVEMLAVVAPWRCYLPPVIGSGGRVWGVSIQLYSIRSRRNWGIGDYTDLASLARLVGQQGADLLGLNPLHARSFQRPDECSPYSPVSRHALDPFSIDIEAIPELAHDEGLRAEIAHPLFQARLATLRAAPLVDYAAVAAVKGPALRRLYDRFQQRADPARLDAFSAFIRRAGPQLAGFARFEALRRHFGGNRPWWEWDSLDPSDEKAVEAETQYQLWLQWMADEQLAGAAAAAREAGMAVGLYGDLAVAAAADGADSWAAPEAMAKATIGAPPDAMNWQGQNWMLPAPNPRALEQSGFSDFRALLVANMRHAGTIRIDHAMALQRLFVIPPGRTGEAGTYMAYPFQALLGILALESQRAGCMVIGEDLGTVPEGFREMLAARGVLSYKVLVFERYPDGAFRSPTDYPPLSLATAATHDLQPIAGAWLGADIEIRVSLGLLTNASVATEEALNERRRLLTLFDWQGVTPNPPPDPGRPESGVAGVVLSAHRLIARSGAAVAMIQLADILGETEPVNIPGTSIEYPNWRRKLALDLDDPAFLDRFAATSVIMRAERPRVAS